MGKLHKMKFYIKKIDLFIVGIAATLIFAVGSFTQATFGTVVLLSFGILMILFVQFEIYRRLGRNYKKLFNELHQSNALQRIYQAINPTRPLPSMRGWAISPDIGWVYISNIFNHKPKTIFECGSGSSTILAAYSLKALGQGKVYALEHEKEFAQKTSDAIRDHGLDNFAEVIFAPLIKQKYGDQEYLWYDKQKLPQVDKIDMLFVDGPPGHIQKLSRYPVLLALIKKIEKNCIILMDDTDRPDEKEIIKRWKKEFSLCAKNIRAEKGGVVLSFEKKNL